MPRKHRQERIGDLLREQVATILHEEFNAPEYSVLTVTRVEVAEDLKTADVYVSVLPDDASEEALTNLEGFAGEAQHELMKRLRIRPLPRIRFVPDTGIAGADAIDKTLANLSDKEERP